MLSNEEITRRPVLHEYPVMLSNEEITCRPVLHEYPQSCYLMKRLHVGLYYMNTLSHVI